MPLSKLTNFILELQKYIYEHDAVREVLIGLQGRRNLMIAWIHDGDEALSVIVRSSEPPGGTAN